MTNISLSNLTSWTLGGGRAIATPINPITEDGPEEAEDDVSPDEWCWFEDPVEEDDWFWELLDELDLTFELQEPVRLFAGLNYNVNTWTIKGKINSLVLNRKK